MLEIHTSAKNGRLVWSGAGSGARACATMGSVAQALNVSASQFPDLVNSYMRGEKGREFSNFLMFLLSANEGRLAACSLELNLALVEEL